MLLCYKNQDMCDKAVHLFDSIPNQHKTQEICDLVVSLYPFLVILWPDKYIIQEMYDEAIADSLASLKLVTDWFVTSKMIKKLYTALHAVDNIIYFN